MIKVEKQLYKVEYEDIKIIDSATGKTSVGKQEKKIKDKTVIVEVEEAFYNKYLLRNPDYKLVSNGSDEEEKARIKAEKEAEKAAKEAEKKAAEEADKVAKEAAKKKKDGDK